MSDPHTLDEAISHALKCNNCFLPHCQDQHSLRRPKYMPYSFFVPNLEANTKQVDAVQFKPLLHRIRRITLQQVCVLAL